MGSSQGKTEEPPSAGSSSSDGTQPAVSDTSRRPSDAELVGMKASNLMRMAAIDLPVPSWFVLDTTRCRDYLTNHFLSAEASEEIKTGIKRLERETRLTFGDKRKPLLVSVRSSAAVSMPGMMDTILNVGLCDITVEGLIRMTGNPRFVWDSYRRFILEYAEVVHGCKGEYFETLLYQELKSAGVASPRDLDAASLKELVEGYLDEFAVETGNSFPQEPGEQLAGAVRAVFESWESTKARNYRAMEDLGELIGTAAIVQQMVYGNMGATSGSGVAFTRNPATGQNQLYMDFLFNAQGEDIVSGRQSLASSGGLPRVLPALYSQIQAVRKRLEVEFKDMQDFEFTVQEGKLFLLQTRNGKRTPWAAVQIAAEMAMEGIIDKATALERLRGFDVHTLHRTVLAKPSKVGEPTAMGLPASDGVAVGRVVLDSESASKLHGSGDSTPLILVRDAISTEDVVGIAACAGILTKTGGKTSHAAVVARQLGKVCVVGCGDLTIDLRNRKCAFNGKDLHEKDYISLDGSTGAVYEGKVDVIVEEPPMLAMVEAWRAERAAASVTDSPNQ